MEGAIILSTSGGDAADLFGKTFGLYIPEKFYANMFPVYRQIDKDINGSFLFRGAENWIVGDDTSEKIFSKKYLCNNQTDRWHLPRTGWKYKRPVKLFCPN